ncbi:MULTISPECIES: hypothetical protein [Kurthia]|uniref:Uncharacterized protein n=1 Tax=Kurthia populi TaxID=1562132 RepID=A0ABW5XY88_9BACL|nr:MULTISPECIES: hypothetical protein [unclassified Kurthia]HIX43193.1 hypothetical protein [Candidatus Kurthia intestinigallinarum]
MEKYFHGLVALAAIISILFVTNIINSTVFLIGIVPVSIIMLIVGTLEIKNTLVSGKV